MTERLAMACALLSVIDFVTLALWLAASRRARRKTAEADSWRNEYLEALKGKVEAAANATHATNLLVDRQNRVVELNTVIVALRRELTDAYALAGLPAGPAAAVLREAVES